MLRYVERLLHNRIFLLFRTNIFEQMSQRRIERTFLLKVHPIRSKSSFSVWLITIRLTLIDKTSCYQNTLLVSEEPQFSGKVVSCVARGPGFEPNHLWLFFVFYIYGCWNLIGPWKNGQVCLKYKGKNPIHAILCEQTCWLGKVGNPATTGIRTRSPTAA